MAVFQKQFDICYSHLDEKRRVKVTALLDFLQDVATAHSDSLGLTLENMRRDGAFWVLVSFDITLHALPQIDERITVETWSSGIKTIYGYRNFRMLAENGAVLLEAVSVWVYMGWETMRPLRVPPEKAALFAPQTPAVLPRKLSLPQPSCTAPALTYQVMRRDIDTNLHMNNVKYLELALETLPQSLWKRTPTHLQLQFLHAATYGEQLHIFLDSSGDSALCCIRPQAAAEPASLVRITYE
ncbi:MAG: hypothetical protein HFI90_09730 [Clostridia bacterium]|nr:hypothetical protein [Clostridia bacterium]